MSFLNSLTSFNTPPRSVSNIYTKEETILKVTGVNKSFGTKHVLRDINMEIKNIKRPGYTQGQVISLIGTSGSGKSTLFNVLAGLLTPDSGTVEINHPLIPVQKGKVGVVFQDYYIYEWHRVENILGLAVSKNPKIKKEERKDAIKQIAEDFGVAGLLHHFPRQLSGGQKQRVALAEQMLNGGDFVLLDEPFSGLDTLMIDKVTELLINVSQSDEMKTLIVVSHDLAAALAISDTVFVMAPVGDLPGSTIKKEICLIDRNLAWKPDIKNNPVFLETLSEVKSLL